MQCSDLTIVIVRESKKVLKSKRDERIHAIWRGSHNSLRPRSIVSSKIGTENTRTRLLYDDIRTWPLRACNVAGMIGEHDEERVA